MLGTRFALKGRFKAGGTVSGTLKTTYLLVSGCNGSEGFKAVT